MRHFVLAATAALALSAPACASPPGGTVLQEVWTEIPGEDVKSLTGNPKYNGPADEARLLKDFKTSGIGNTCGSRLTATLVPPTSGIYTFWIASDDHSELWLSPGSSPAGKRLIGRVSAYTDRDAWDKDPAQRSSPIRLEAGQSYFIQALHKEAGGPDHVSVAWQGPGIQRQVIAGKHLRRPKLSQQMRATIEKTERARARLRKQLEAASAYWEAGKTLPVQYSSTFAFDSPAPLPGDTGINVLIDQSHQTAFVMLWGLRGLLRGQGFRVCTSLASLDSVLDPAGQSRIRLHVGEMTPFAWWPNAKYNVIITSQQDLNAEPYTDKERAALREFVKGGGGLMIFGGGTGTKKRGARWSMNKLAADLGAWFTHETDELRGRRYATLRLDKTWRILASGAGGSPIRASRQFGRGRVIIWEERELFAPDNKKDSAETRKEKLDRLKTTITWLAGGKPPVRGDWRFPCAGGAGIFPELEQNLGGVVVYYSGNQGPEVLNCIRNQLPKAADQLLAWLPNKKFDEPYFIVICGGTGGGWAINARPKAAAVIEYRPLAILSVFGHEMAHTMGGPRNAKGELAGRSPHFNQGEAHAGWFQGKIGALFSGKSDRPNRNCNRILAIEKKKGAKLDLATEYEVDAGRKKWGRGGLEWTKLWYIWQKLDDRYGPTWYPRWYWVRTTRWMDDPGHQETWDEMVEDMSIAVGEDLFPFFRKVGTTLTKDRLERIEFRGKVLELPVAPIENTPAGNVNIEPIGDYTKPLTFKRDK